MALSKEYQNLAVEEADGIQNPNGHFLFRNTTNFQSHHQESQSLINFKCGIDNLLYKTNQSNLLSFEPDGLSPNAYNWDQNRLMEDQNCFQSSTNYNSISTPDKENKSGDGSVYDHWLYSEPPAAVSDTIHEDETQESGNQKRPHMGESEAGVCKKQCTVATKKQKPKSTTAKDPQSIAAKNRRERISERLKMLQELVPNGSKVDLVTMLEKAISYVKFLQLQVKILATDDFWPVQGGKAPDISQVKEAIDAILSSERERTSSSNSGK